jgi:hypothetical protein
MMDSIDLLPGIALRSSSERGRYCVASRDYVKGDIIVVEESYASVMCHAYASSYCAYCGISPSDGQIYALGPDDSFRYCSQDCMRLDYSMHQYENQAFKRLMELGISGGSEACNLLVRLASTRKIEQNNINEDLKYPLLGR